ncbi:MAG: hypothetical protein ABW166_21335 [Sedimenticola sp.]
MPQPQMTVPQTIQDFYVYEEDFLELAGGASAIGSINIQADSDFVVQKLTYFVTAATPAGVTDSSRIIPPITVQITDSGSGRNLFEAPVPLSNVFGIGELPFILPKPKLFLARSTISISVTNLTASTEYDLYLSLIGYKVFRL